MVYDDLLADDVMVEEKKDKKWVAPVKSPCTQLWNPGDKKQKLWGRKTCKTCGKVHGDECKWVEFQKRGLPHAHLCLFMHAVHKLPTVEYIDPFISAEKLDKKLDPELTPSVIRLPFHLPGQQQVIYESFDDLNDILDKPSVASSMFSEWFKCNQNYPEARTLIYVEFPTKFVWKADKRYWKPREKGFSIGIIHAVSSSLGEVYYLRILLNKVKGPTTFSQIRTVNSVEYPTFRDACYAYGLLGDENEYVEAIIEESFTGTGYYLRILFCTLLMSESMSRPEFVWETTWSYLSDDILYKQRIVLKHPGLELNEEQLKNLTLFEIEKFLLRNNSTLKKFSTMPFPNKDSISSENNLLLSEELAYDKAMLAQEFEILFSSSTNEQHFGGTGKTYLWKTLCASIRSQGKIVLSVAPSGIASLLLSGGRTAHSREEREYLSSDNVCPTGMINENLVESLCSPDILNGVKASGLPNHKLVLKVGVPVMLLRNIDQKSRLCNGTRLKVVSLGKRIIQMEIISGSNIGDRHYIPRITLIPTDKKLDIKLQRRQYPLALCFAMTINKS
ncbi:uncharacterized protein LOC143580381 [Bidens hawaiensis]|uniref:uncharacterized protein LOC143580381 n=1 Tax=Bidens hawaiensis TaxID=980011 RepID=UPI00404A836D